MILDFSKFHVEQQASWAIFPMKYLSVEAVQADGTCTQIGRLEQGEVFIGREPGDGGITVDNSAVSRQHGVFFRGRNQWLFKDLASTNGCWLNGTPLKGEHWKLVRDGDVLQMADSVLKLSEIYSSGFDGQSSSSTLGGRGLIVFSHGTFQEEYPVPEYGRALVVGGSRGDLALDGDLAELPTLVVERRGDKICAFGLAKELNAYLNGVDIREAVSLKDGDELRVGQYQIIFSDPSTVERKEASPVPGTPLRDPGSIIKTVDQTTKLGSRDWGSSGDLTSANKTQIKSQFGQGNLDSSDLDETMSIDPRALRRGETGYSNEYSKMNSVSLESVEDKVILIIGGLLVFAVLVLVMWWFLG